MKCRFIVFVLTPFLLLPVSNPHAQNAALGQDSAVRSPPALNINPNPEKLPAGYRSIMLGMDIENVKLALKADSLFGYRGERDVSLLPGENRTLIETVSDGYLQRCWFQFYENKLYTVILNFNPEKMDYYSVFTRLLEKYGEPVFLTPEKAHWQDEDVSLSLERPVSVKYIDKKVFEKLNAAGRAEETVSEIIRSGILDDL